MKLKKPKLKNPKTAGVYVQVRNRVTRKNVSLTVEDTNEVEMVDAIKRLAMGVASMGSGSGS